MVEQVTSAATTYVDAIVVAEEGLLTVISVFPVILRLRTEKDKRTLSIKPDKLSTRIGTLNGDVPWTKVDSLHVTYEHIFVMGKNMNGFAIPRRAFVDETQRTEFIRTCEQYIQAAGSNN